MGAVTNPNDFNGPPDYDWGVRSSNLYGRTISS